MAASLAHLPLRKQKELRLITSIIRKMAPVEMIILFGSHARGNWVEDKYQEGLVAYEYKSDFDILIVTKNKETSNNTLLWDRVEDHVDLQTTSVHIDPTLRR